MAAGADPAAWRSYYLFYHADRGRLLDEVVRPVAASLLAGGEISGFYFIRYGLGGPHVRLRVRPAPGRAEVVGEMVRSAAAEFFRRSPSVEPLSEDAVRRQNRELIAGDPLAGPEDDRVHGDNTVVEFPVRFEVERYGGPALLEHSLDLFTLSSVEVLHFLTTHGGRPAGRRLTEAFRLVARQAWGHAADGDAFIGLAGYTSRFFTAEPLARFFTLGEEEFERRRDAFVHLLREELAALAVSDDDPASTLADGARLLAREIRDADAGRRWQVAASQIHMTANRLGLLNPEEIYLSRMLWRAAKELAGTDPAFWRGVWETRRRRPARPGELGELTRTVLARLATRAPARGGPSPA